MAALEIVAPQSLSETRGISEYVCELFNVTTVKDGWTWQTKTADGKAATRWKSRYSIAPEGVTSWAKYRWLPEKPANAHYCYPVSLSLMSAIKDADGVLYMVGGEIALMSMMSAGFLNATCTFGDSTIPTSLKDDLLKWGVKTLRLIPDRDESGLKWAVNIRDVFKDQLVITVETLALPYEVVKSHGSDVNDFWLDNDAEAFAFAEKIKTLSVWVLPEPVAPASKQMETFSVGESVNLPHDFIRDIEIKLGVEGGYQGDGWSRKPVRCPFHNDEHPSAHWNHEIAVLKCFSGCGTSYNAKATGEQLGLRLKDYLDSTPTLKVVTREPALPATTETPTVKTPVVAIPHSPAKQLRPPLPEFARLTVEQEALATAGRKWLDSYIEWAQEASPLTPRNFHEAMALWLLATVSTRRIHCRIGAEDIYSNLYILIVGKTTIYRKSTAMKLAKSVLYKAGLSALLLPSDATPEALFDELAGIKPINFDNLPTDAKDRWIKGRAVAAQRSFMKDEASSIFASLKRDYMAGLSELLLQGYDGDGGTLDKRLKSKGLVTAKDLCLSFLGATTPIMYSKYIGNEERENGFAARFALITPESEMSYRNPSDVAEIPPPLIAQLGTLFRTVLPWHGDKEPSASLLMEDVQTPPSVTALISPEAFECLNQYRRALGWDMPVNDTVDENKAAAYARLGTMAIKVATLLAAVSANERPVRIEGYHAYAAQMIVEQWRESLHRLDQDVARSRASDNDENKLLELIKQSGPYGVTIREMMQALNIRPRSKAVEALQVLGEDGLIEKFERKLDGRGRPTTSYRIAGVHHEQ